VELSTPCPTPKLEDQTSILVTPRDRVVSYTPRHCIPILVTFYDMHELHWDYSYPPVTTGDYVSFRRRNLLLPSTYTIICSANPTLSHAYDGSTLNAICMLTKFTSQGLKTYETGNNFNFNLKNFTHVTYKPLLKFQIRANEDSDGTALRVS
jgi:hypothetical protein